MGSYFPIRIRRGDPCDRPFDGRIQDSPLHKFISPLPTILSAPPPSTWGAQTRSFFRARRYGVFGRLVGLLASSDFPNGRRYSKPAGKYDGGRYAPSGPQEISKRDYPAPLEDRKSVV